LENGANTAGEIELMDTQLMAICGAGDDDEPQVLVSGDVDDGSHKFELHRSEKQVFFSEEKEENVKSGF
jgi:hypothetical protein